MSIINYTSKCALLAVAIVTVAFGSGCSTTHRTSSLPQTHMLDGYDDFETAGQRAPSAKTLYRLASLLAAQERYQQAEAVLVSAIERYRNFSPAYSQLASIQLRTDRLEDAVSTIEAGLAVQPNDHVLLNNLGLCMMIQKEYGSAYEAYNAAWALAPTNKRYAANAALALGMLGRTNEAREIYSSIMPTSGANHNISVINKALGIDGRMTSDVTTAEMDMETEDGSFDDQSGEPIAGVETSE